MRHNCGCCSDSPLGVWPYIETESGKVYSDPAVFMIGEMHWISGDKPYKGWEEQMRKYGISEVVIGKISEYFRACVEERKRLTAEEDGEEI